MDQGAPGSAKKRQRDSDDEEQGDSARVQVLEYRLVTQKAHTEDVWQCMRDMYDIVRQLPRTPDQKAELKAIMAKAGKAAGL